MPIEKPDDYREDPAAPASPPSRRLRSRARRPARRCSSTANGAAPRPPRLSDVCEGTRTVELRGAEGRLVRRIAVKTGETMRVARRVEAGVCAAAGRIRACRPASRIAAPTWSAPSPASQQVTVFVPSGRDADEALKAQQMPPEWLAFDAGRRPLGGAAALNAAARRDLSTRFARALDVQGIAAISQPSPSSPDLVIALIAAGAGEPDVVPVTPERMDSIEPRDCALRLRAAAVAPRHRPARGRRPRRRTGSSSCGWIPGAPGDQAGIKPGDVLVRADGAADHRQRAAAAADRREAARGCGVDRGARRGRHGAHGAAAGHREPAPDVRGRSGPAVQPDFAGAAQPPGRRAPRRTSRSFA